MFNTTLQDLRYAFRALLKHRNFTVAALLTLALGIGINTGIFTLLYSLAFRPLPVKDPDTVVSVFQSFEGEFSRQVEGNVELFSYPEYVSYRDRVTGFSGLIASADAGLYLGSDNVERINGLLVTDNYFSLLGGTSALGRTFFDKECQAPMQCPLAVISHDFWQRRFGSDQNVIGSSLTLNRQSFTIIGVAARDFHGAEISVPDVWIPITMQPAVKPDNNLLTPPNCSWLSVFGRLKDGASIQQVQAEMQLIAAQMDQEYPGRKSIVNVTPGSYLNSPEARSEGTPIAILDQEAVVTVEPLEENVRRMLEPERMGAWFAGTVSLLALLIAATGIYGMLSYHVAERTSEIGIRMALGAQRRNVLMLIVGDGMKLAGIGTAIGVVTAIGLTKVMATLLFGVVSTDAATFAAVSIGALAVAFLACYIPAHRATKVDPLVTLRNE